MEFTEQQKELRREYWRKYHAAHRERLNARRRARYAENADRIREERRTWYQNNREKQAEYMMHSIEKKMHAAARE